MMGLLLGPLVMGIIIAVMEEEEFPGWLTLIICVIATTVPALIIERFVLSTPYNILGLTVGAVAGGAAISALCDMSLQRASIAAGLYLGIFLAIKVLLEMAMA